jgi:hypothetical protein
MLTIHIIFKEILRILLYGCVQLAKKTKTKKAATAAKKKEAPAKEPAKAKQAAKSPAKPAARELPAAKLEVTPKLRKIWFSIRHSYDISLEAFSNSLSLLSDEEANMLYELVRLALYMGSPAEILRAHPQMKEFIRTDDDRLCMHDIYEHLSWRLGRSEPMPKDRQLISKFRLAVKGNLIP